MLHEFEYDVNGQRQSISSYLVVKGENSLDTAMAKTVGLPVAISAKMILQKKITLKGVVIPTVREVYEPVMQELEKFGMRFEEKVVV